MATETAGIREIDAGTLPDRYARGWHCLGPVKDFLDGEPHGIEAFGTHLVVFGDSHGDVHVLDQAHATTGPHQVLDHRCARRPAVRLA